MNPVCVKCQVEMICNKIGVSVAPEHNPSHQYNGDLYRCPICDSRVVIGFGAANTSDSEPTLVLRSN